MASALDAHLRVEMGIKRAGLGKMECRLSIPGPTKIFYEDKRQNTPNPGCEQLESRAISRVLMNESTRKNKRARGRERKSGGLDRVLGSRARLQSEGKWITSSWIFGISWESPITPPACTTSEPYH